MTRLFTRRVWLNRDRRTRAALMGHVLVEVDGYRGNSSVDARISFADCNRNAELEFDLYAPSAADIALLREKAHRLRDFVNAWATAYDTALDRVERRLEDAST